jgi:hypothetical protein
MTVARIFQSLRHLPAAWKKVLRKIRKKNERKLLQTVLLAITVMPVIMILRPRRFTGAEALRRELAQGPADFFGPQAWLGYDRASAAGDFTALCTSTGRL